MDETIDNCSKIGRARPGTRYRAGWPQSESSLNFNKKSEFLEKILCIDKSSESILIAALQGALNRQRYPL